MKISIEYPRFTSSYCAKSLAFLLTPNRCSSETSWSATAVFIATKILRSFAVDGKEMRVQSDFLQFFRAIHEAGKPIGLVSLVPLMALALCCAA